MKKIYLLFLLTLLPFLASADPVEIDGIYYNLDSKAKTAEVTENPNKYSGNIDIPKIVTYQEVSYNVTSIRYSAFSFCIGLTSIIIPNSVTSIGSSAFTDCTALTSISIPNSVTTIRYNTFEGCYSLTSVTIPNSVTSIERSVFEGCSALTSVTVPNSVTSIGDGAFKGCTSLTSVSIPNSVTSIEGNAFSRCTALTSVKVESGNPKYDSRENCNAIIETASNTLVTGCKNTIIPKKVTSIGQDAFWGCSGLTSVTIPNRVESIKPRAFGECSGLTSVTIPNSVKSIEMLAFAACSGLNSIKVESDNPKYDSRNNCNAIIETASNTLIAGCKNTIIPSDVISIGLDAFSGCSGLTSVTIPNSVTSIGDGAFGGCTGLTSATIPNSVTFIGGFAFSGCKKLTLLKIGSGTNKIDYYAFENCPELTDVYCYAEKVPNTSREAFINIINSIMTFEVNATLHVPEGSVDAYKAVVPWSYFKNIVAIEATGIKNLEGTTAGPFDVYDLSGRKVLTHVTSLEGMPNGIYIVNGKKILKK